LRRPPARHAKINGDPGVTSVAVKMRGNERLEETDKRDGKVIGVFKFTVAADGRTAEASSDDELGKRLSTST
jgi:hypothetical protein